MIPKFYKGMSNGEALRPAMEVTDADEAREYFEAYVQSLITNYGQPRDKAESVVRQNLGYFAGYYDDETRARVERLFGCEHPVFGAITNRGAPTAEEALAAGRALAAKHLNR